MAPPETEPGAGHSFGLEFDGIQIKSITEVSGLKMEQDVVQLEQNGPDGNDLPKKLRGRWKAGELALRRPLTRDTSLDNWIKDSQLGKLGEAEKDVALVIYDHEGAPLKRYKITAAWPKSLEVKALKAGDTSVLTEKLVVTYERLEPE